MRTPARLGLVVLVAAPLALGACAATPSVDLDEARAWLETVQAEQSDGPGSAGSASMLVQDSADHDDEDEGIRLDFAAPTDLKRAEARCFGGGTVDVLVTVFSAGGTTSDTADLAVPCDEDPHDIVLDSTASSAALISAHGSSATYVHVELIQTLTVER